MVEPGHHSSAKTSTSRPPTGKQARCSWRQFTWRSIPSRIRICWVAESFEERATAEATSVAVRDIPYIERASNSPKSEIRWSVDLAPVLRLLTRPTAWQCIPRRVACRTVDVVEIQIQPRERIP
jgi:hypothetical protein